MVSTLWNRLWSLKGGCSTTKPRKKLLVEFGGGFQLRIMASSVKDVYCQIAKWSAEPFPSGVGYREIVTAERNKDWHGHRCSPPQRRRFGWHRTAGRRAVRLRPHPSREGSRRRSSPSNSVRHVPRT